MAASNRERVSKGLDLLASGLRPFVERELKSHLGDTWQSALPDTTERGPRVKPRREVVTPDPDGASGRYQQAEFAAALWQVYQGKGSDEYKNPTEFFRRTFLTEGLRRLLSQAVLGLSGKGGDPVVELQTNFG